MFLHDEVLVHTPAALADEVAVPVRDCAHQAGRLLFGRDGGASLVDFPLDVAVVAHWGEADEPGYGHQP